MLYKFEAEIKKNPDIDATYIEIPFDVEKEFGSKRVKVVATFDNVKYRGSIVKMGFPCYIIGITKEIRKQICKEAGDTIKVEIQKDEEIREITLPEDFKVVLEKNKEVLEFYESLSYSAKKKYYQWITSAKKDETRVKRIDKAVDNLLKKIRL